MPGTNAVKDEKGDMVTDCHGIFGWKEEIFL